ncbi:GNAT family protein [Streptomyces sp. NPDC096040]|uniref:GNAT family N-acetyltransferase n=1 Tax=Streptomyces sp. NPDC096040 TaxID=3155541 RepID=UPI00333470C0
MGRGFRGKDGLVTDAPRAGRAAQLPLPGPCWARRHTLRTERLLIYTPETALDIAAAACAASDPEAQRWLGWDRDIVTGTRLREAVLQLCPGDTDALRSSPVARRLLGEPFEPHPDRAEVLIGVRVDDGRHARVTALEPGTAQIGGWLAPHALGLGLGTELFRAAVHLGHAHLGLRTVRAGHEPANTASARALAGAGLVTDDGPPRHTLPDGREIERTPATAHGDGTGLPPPGRGTDTTGRTRGGPSVAGRNHVARLDVRTRLRTPGWLPRRAPRGMSI